MMVERTIVLPTQDNEGHSLAREVSAIRREILEIAGGYSELRQQGAWLDAGVTYHDKAIRLVTTLTREDDRRLLDRLPDWCEALRQVCLYTHAVEVAATFVYPRVASKAS